MDEDVEGVCMYLLYVCICTYYRCEYIHTHIEKYKQWNITQPLTTDEILSFAATWIDLEGIMLSEVSQRKINTVGYHLSVESKKHNKLVNITEK